MIKTFACKETEDLWLGNEVTHIAPEIQERSLKKLRLLDAAIHLDDLSAIPGNHFEHLHGDRLGQMSIRVNERWRICFTWDHGDVYDVEIVDYH